MKTMILSLTVVFVIGCSGNHSTAEPGARAGEDGMEFKVEKSDGEWRKELTPEQYRVARCGGTEPAGSGKYNKHYKDGSYTCVCCGYELFSSDHKYDSGSGWPSFYKPAGTTNTAERLDTSHGMVRTEVLCPQCGAHLGHVFNDGPAPTGKRYCINSVALDFEPEK